MESLPSVREVYWYGVSKKGLEKKMKVKCIWEHNGDDTLLYAEDCVGAFTRGESLDVALHKMKKEIQSYSVWLGEKMQIVTCYFYQRKNLLL